MDSRFKVGNYVTYKPSYSNVSYFGIVSNIDRAAPYLGLSYFVEFKLCAAPTHYWSCWIHDDLLETVTEEEAALYILGSNN